MKRYFLSFFYISIFTTTFAQTQTIKIKKEKFIHAAFPGGKEGIKKYLNKAISANMGRRLMPGENVEFNAQVEISETGQISKVNLLKGSTRSFIDSIYINALETMPAWMPAKDQNGINCKDKQFVSFVANSVSGIMFIRGGGRGRPNRCQAKKEDFVNATNIVGMIEDQLYVDSTKTGIVLCRIILADIPEYVDSKVMVVIQECNWNITHHIDHWNIDSRIPGCYNCDMVVLTDKPKRFHDICWDKYKDAGYKNFTFWMTGSP